MTDESVEILIVTVVWGDWHLRAFLDVNLPTLLAPRNFPALFERHRGLYQIYTRRADFERIQGSATFQRLTSLVTVDLRIIEDEARLSRPIETHIEIWREAIDHATRMRKLALLMPPDVLWSDGSFAHVAELLARGKKAIFSAFLRVTSNSFLPAFRARFGETPALVDLSGCDLVDLCLEHLHPLMAAYSRGSRYFPYHSEMIIWPVPGEGLAVRILARELLMYDPSRIRLNAAQLIAGEIPWDELHMIADSDDLFGVSLAPFGKDATWHRTAWQATTREVARWWVEYDSRANDYVAGVRLRWHYRPTTEALWRARELGADLFVRRAALEREALRLIGHIFEDKLGSSVQIGRLLAALIIKGIVARALRGMPRLQTRTVFAFVPEDDAIGAEAIASWAALADAPDGGIESVLRDHVAIAPALVDANRRRRLHGIALEFASGACRTLRRSWRGWTIGDMRITRIERASDALLVCYICGALGTPARPPAPPARALAPDRRLWEGV